MASVAGTVVALAALALIAAGQQPPPPSADIPRTYLFPYYNATYAQLEDTSGMLLQSESGLFAVGFYSPTVVSGDGDGYAHVFLSVVHHPTRTQVWHAASHSSIIESMVFSFTPKGIAVVGPSNPTPAWTTPPLAVPAAKLRLLDNGELSLLDAAGAVLWSTFQEFSQTLLPGQLLPLSAGLFSPASTADMSPGAYRLVITSSDASLQWAVSSGTFQTYWSLSTDARAVRNSGSAAFLAIDNAGLKLLAEDATTAVFTVPFAPPASKSEQRFAVLDITGRFRAVSYSPERPSTTLTTLWTAPPTDCELPFQCQSLGLCTVAGNSSSCACPNAFSAYSNGGCAPADGSAVASALAALCGASSPQRVSYVSLGAGIGYFSYKYASPLSSGTDIAACESLCTGNCSCLGYFYKNSTRSCFLVQQQIGTVYRTTSSDASSIVGYIKTVPSSSPDHRGSTLNAVTVIFGIVLPAAAGILLVVVIVLMGRQWCHGKSKEGKQWEGQSSDRWLKGSAPARTPSMEEEAADKFDEEEAILIPGLPTRFTYAQLEAATRSFKAQIGTGGFGSVYKGDLLDGSAVAVKKMNSLGFQGRREFLTELAVIGNIHHVNLVKLRGFCSEGARLLLVYEYMNCGSLDKCLFRPGPALSWPDRMRVALGSARGLAYLHAGCDRKIIHCDVKPENILLDDRGGVKIADFGLAKLLTPEQSGLFTTMRGTRGYLAPEWLMSAPITDRADVYSFGMVLLEIVRGRKNSKVDDSGGTAAAAAADASNRSSSYFPALAVEMHEQGRYEELLDPKLEKKADGIELARVVRVALCCIQEDAGSRPAMPVVSGMLDGSIQVWEPRVELLGYLRLHHRGFADFTPSGGNGLVGGSKGKDKAGSETTDCSWSPPSCVSAQQLSGAR